jgi:hypothetical protein
MRSKKREAKERQNNLTKTQEVTYAHELKSGKTAENETNATQQNNEG